jgi:hypothetical protein
VPSRVRFERVLPPGVEIRLSREEQTARGDHRGRARFGCGWRRALSTHTFQAPGFYARLGYAECGLTPGYPHDHDDIQSPSPLVGYCIINADSLEEAESLARTMPIIESVRVYEAYSM